MSLSDVLIVAVTDYGQEDDRRHAGESGIDHHLIKPVELKEVERLLKEGKSVS